VDADALALHCTGEAHKIVVAKLGAEDPSIPKVIDYNQLDYEKFSE
jgi:hypothetical protein